MRKAHTWLIVLAAIAAAGRPRLAQADFRSSANKRSPEGDYSSEGVLTNGSGGNVTPEPPERGRGAATSVQSRAVVDRRRFSGAPALLPEPSAGLEPATPSLPWKCSTS